MRLIDADALLQSLDEKDIRYSADINNAIIDAPTAEPMEEHPEAAEGDRKLIDADRLIVDILDSPKIETNTIPGLLKVIYKQPAVEAQPKTGRWIDGADGSAFCSECGTEWLSDQVKYYKFCPICGKQMEAEE